MRARTQSPFSVLALWLWVGLIGQNGDVGTDRLERRIARQDQQVLPEQPPDLHPLPNVLVALVDPARAGFVARGLRAGGLVPVLAFNDDDVRSCLTRNRFVLLLLQDEFASMVHDQASPRQGYNEPAPPLLIVGDHASQLEADDHLRADASVEEISARATALVRISRPVALPAPLRWGPLELDVQRRISRWDGALLGLTSIQFRIMEILVFAVGSVVAPVELSRRLWGTHSFEDAERLGAHIRRIRKTLRSVGAADEFLVTVRGEGFRLAEQDLEGTIDLHSFQLTQ